MTTFQYALFSFGVFLILIGLFAQNWILVGLGVPIAALALGTVVHLITGKYNIFSKLPPDFKFNLTGNPEASHTQL